jgi:hypothetical protein
MTTSDYILDLALIGIVFLQIRGRRLSAYSLLTPIIIVAVVARTYLTSVPTSGNDLLLIGAGAAVGIALGAGAGLFTKLTRDTEGQLMATAGWAAAVLWVVGVGSRFAFQEYASHGGGAPLAHFSAHHDITTMQAWVAALVLMALGEALTRTAVLGARAFGPALLPTRRPAAPPAGTPTAMPATTAAGHIAGRQPTMMGAGEGTY